MAFKATYGLREKLAIEITDSCTEHDVFIPTAAPQKLEASLLSPVDDGGDEGVSGVSRGGSFSGGPPPESFSAYNQDLGQGPSPGIGFGAGPGLGPSGPSSTNYNNIQIPPGAHAPANTPAELAPPTGERQKLCTFLLNWEVPPESVAHWRREFPLWFITRFRIS